MNDRYAVKSVDEAAGKIHLEECPPLFQIRGSEPFKPDSLTLGTLEVEGRKAVVGLEVFVTKKYAGSRRAGTLRLVGARLRIAKTTLQQERDRIERRHEREQNRRSALPTMKYFKADRSGFSYCTAVRPFTDAEKSSDHFVDHDKGMFIGIELHYRKVQQRSGKISLQIQPHVRTETGSYSVMGGRDGVLSDRSLTISEGLKRIDHKILTETALKLDSHLPEICALFEKDKDAALELVKQKLGRNALFA